MEKIKDQLRPSVLRHKLQREARIENAREHAGAAYFRWVNLFKAGDRAASDVWRHLSELYDQHAVRLRSRTDRINATPAPRTPQILNRLQVSTPNLDAAEALAKIICKGGDACTP